MCHSIHFQMPSDDMNAVLPDFSHFFSIHLIGNYIFIIGISKIYLNLEAVERAGNVLEFLLYATLTTTLLH